MPPTVVRLPFPSANGTQEQSAEDVPSHQQSGNHIRLDILNNHMGEKVMTPKRASPLARPRRSQVQAANSTPQKTRSPSLSATESEGENCATASTPATPPSANGSASKRTRAEAADSSAEDDPRPATKRKGGRKRQSQGNTKSPKKAAAMAVEEKQGGNLWEVERIVGARIEADTYIHWYQVKWKGYSAKHNTWEPKKNLASCQDMIEDFERLEKDELKAKKKQNKMK